MTSQPRDEEQQGRCPVCGTATTQGPRYPRALCPACAGRATDLAGRPIALYNESFSGGLEARHRDDGSVCRQVSQDGRVVVDGVEYRASEARFGGTVVQAAAFIEAAEER